jgi:hypothetical protein
VKKTIKIPILSTWRGEVRVYAPGPTYTETAFEEALTRANQARQNPADVVTIVEAEVEFLSTAAAQGRPVSPSR